MPWLRLSRAVLTISLICEIEAGLRKTTRRASRNILESLHAQAAVSWSRLGHRSLQGFHSKRTGDFIHVGNFLLLGILFYQLSEKVETRFEHVMRWNPEACHSCPCTVCRLRLCGSSKTAGIASSTRLVRAQMSGGLFRLLRKLPDDWESRCFYADHDFRERLAQGSQHSFNYKI